MASLTIDFTLGEEGYGVLARMADERKTSISDVINALIMKGLASELRAELHSVLDRTLSVLPAKEEA